MIKITRKPFIALSLIGLCIAILYISIYIKSSPSVLFAKVKKTQVVTPTDFTNVISQLPIYPQAQLVHNEIVNDPTVENFGKRYVVLWNSNDQTPQISQWYQKNIVTSGWTMSIPPADQTASIQQIEFQKTDTTLTVSIIRQEIVSEITLNYRPGPVMEEGEAGQ